MRCPPLTCFALLLLLLWAFASALAIASEPADYALCQHATAAAEHESGVPDQLLDAISRVESGRFDHDQGSLRAWPWTINAEGQGHFYGSEAEAIEAARQFQAKGIQSIDVGCTQINLMFHPTAFGSLQEAFDPGHNAAYAARFLAELFHQTGSWPHAAAAYHSQTPELGTDYQRKVLEAWADPIDRPGASQQPEHGTAPRSSEFHRQLASMSSLGAAGAASISTRPFGRSSLNMAMSGYGRLPRGGRLFGGGGRDLSAYRATPVAMLTMPRRLSRY